MTAKPDGVLYMRYVLLRRPRLHGTYYTHRLPHCTDPSSDVNHALVYVYEYVIFVMREEQQRLRGTPGARLNTKPIHYTYDQ